MNDEIREDLANENAELTPELLEAGKAVAGLERPAAPAGLAERALARAAGALPHSATKILRPAWWRRQITHPAARVAAALLIVVLLGSCFNFDTAERVGVLSERVIGTKVVDMVDDSLIGKLPVKLNEQEFERYVERLVGEGRRAEVEAPSLRPVLHKPENSTALPSVPSQA